MKTTPYIPTAENGTQSLDIFAQIYGLFYFYLNLTCLYRPNDPSPHWFSLFFSGHRLPFDFEIAFRKEKYRERHNLLYFNKLKTERRTLVAKHMGFYEIFTPVLSKEGRCRGFLVTGPFLKAPSTLDQLCKQWDELSDRKASPWDPDFQAYVRMATNVKVLNPSALEGCKELLEILASYLSGNSNEGMAERINGLRKDVLSHHLQQVNWIDFLVGLEHFYPGPRIEEGVAEYEREEFGITRHPTTVMVVSRQSTEQGQWSMLESMVGACRLQWESLWIARDFPETVAGKLEDYGAIFVTSASPNKSKVQARLEIRERLESIQRGLERRMGSRLFAGIGTTQQGGGPLVESRRQAVLAMNLCVSLGRSFVFFEDYAQQAPPARNFGFRQALNRLLKAYTKGLVQEKDLARGEYTRQVLLYSKERNESLRAHLIEAIFALVERLRGQFIPDEELDHLINSTEENLLSAASTQDLLRVFREGLDMTWSVRTKPRDAKKFIRIEKVKNHIDEHFTEPLRLENLAEKMGCSVPSFLQVFRRKTGMGFSQYLQEIRIKEAKRMLRAGSLTITLVAQECGFNSVSYFIQAFRRSTGLSPKQYRDSVKDQHLSTPSPENER